ncbi:MAG TPA: NAD(P)/FAD-dependent oxidoreductase [Bryobacteraceae bacterium]
MTDTAVDVVVIGAGAAGLVALRELDRAGVSVLAIEARSRIGGRVFTVHDPAAGLPLELGPEFIHGHPSEIFNELKSANLAAYDVSGEALDVDRDTPRGRDDEGLSEAVDRLMDDLVTAGETGEDKPFSEWLASTAYPDAVKQRATRFVEGFNAARREVIGIASLALDTRASDALGTERNYRIFQGYNALLQHIFDGVTDANNKLRLNRVVEQVEWNPGSATVHTRSMLTGSVETIRCQKVVVTVPLGVLQADPGEKGAIRFQPEPATILAAAAKLRFGQVVRIALRFREPFWESLPRFSNASFLFSQEPLFPTWWTALPVRTPIMVGWSAGPNADTLLDRSESEIVDAALASYARITRVDPSEVCGFLEAAYLHKWNEDPFARGAYSYVPAGALAARETLASPVADTLYFAGEATETTGHGGTVNGAMSTGFRAATQVLSSLTRKT